ncbi:MAG TPA: hypothetical protein PKD85_13895, partial [Saprospiraceae bacterium]|nr:hypothetical protein [Saprospiraceae bacterium]
MYRIDPFDKKTYGIYQKLKNQIRAWKSFGYDCDTITFDNHKLTFNGNVLRNNTEYPLGSLWNTTLLFLQWITWSNLDFKKYDIVLIRHTPIGWGLKSLIAQIKSTH